jgi:hypothetical protein
LLFAVPIPKFKMASPSSDYKFEGWQALDASAAEGKMVWQEFQPKAWEENDIDVRLVFHSCGGRVIS